MGARKNLVWRARAASLVALAAFPLGAKAEDWDVFQPVDEVACAMLARADNLEQLDSLNLGREYLQRAALGNFDFVGPAGGVPFHPGCGEVWVAGCPNAAHPLRWIKIRPGTCLGVAGAVEGAGQESFSNPSAEKNFSTGIADGTEAGTGKAAGALEGPKEQVTEGGDLITGGPPSECPKPVEEIKPEPITPKIATVAAGVPELEENFHRHNHSANISGARKGVPDKSGGEEIHKEANASARVKESDASAINGLFVSIAGTSISNGALTAVAIVAQNGMSREITALIQVSGVHDKAHFFKDAGSLDFAQLQATLVERKKQIALAAALEEVRAALEAMDAPKDAKIVGDYILLAQQRAANLASAACHLAKFAATNASNDKKIKSLATMLNPSTGGLGSGKAVGTSESSISGVGDASRKLAMHLGNLAIAREGQLGGRIGEEGILESFGPAPAEENKQAAAESADPLDPEKNLFEKVHGKYRQLDERNTFPRSLMD